jgi:signal transduction histidine kinase
MTAIHQLEVFLDDAGVVRHVAGDGASSVQIQIGRPLIDQLARHSLALLAYVNSIQHRATGSTLVLVLRTEDGDCTPYRAAMTPIEGGWRFELSRAGDGQASLLTAFESQERSSLLSVLADIVGQRVDLTEALSEGLPWITQYAGMEAGAFFLLSERSKADMLAAFGRTRKRGFPYPHVDFSASDFRQLLSGQVLPLPSDGGHEGVRAVACRGARQIVLVPCAWSGAVNGVLQLSRRVFQESTWEQEHGLLAVGRLLGLAARLANLATRSERSSAVLGTAYTVSRAISGSLDLDYTFKQIAYNATRLIPGSRCLLLELSPASDEFLAVASSEPDDELVGLRLRLQDASALMSGYLELEVEELIYSTQISPSFRSKLKMESAVLLPMLAQNELVGSLLLFTSGPRGMVGEVDLALAAEVAEQAAVAIHNARLYDDLARSRASIQGLVQRITRVREHERREAAAILHDDVLQSVIGVLYELESLRESVDEESSDKMDHALGVLRDAIDEARVVIADLRPPQLEQLGFAPAMRALAERSDQDGPARVECTLDDVRELQPEQLGALYRIARQALVNAQRHAQAKTVWLTLRRETSEQQARVTLAIADDGIGMQLPPPPDSEHFGLAMMEEQAVMAGGSLEFHARLSGGTVVEAHLPLPGSESAEEGQA